MLFDLQDLAHADIQSTRIHLRIARGRTSFFLMAFLGGLSELENKSVGKGHQTPKRPPSSELVDKLFAPRLAFQVEQTFYG